MYDQCIYRFRVYMRTNSDYLPNSINGWVFITEIESVNYALRTGSLNIILCFILKEVEL